MLHNDLVSHRLPTLAVRTLEVTCCAELMSTKVAPLRASMWCSTGVLAYRPRQQEALQRVCGCAGAHPACNNSLAMLHPAMCVHPDDIMCSAQLPTLHG